MWGQQEAGPTVAGKRTADKAAPKGKPGKPGKGSGIRPGKPRRRWLTILKWAGVAALAGTALVAATVAFTFWMYGRDPNLPKIEKLADYHPKQVTTILDANDRRIGELFSERRTFVPYDKIPPIVIDSFVAAEDNGFWTHGGVDYIGMVRAFFTNIKAGKTKQGASTITQQVVKTFLLTPERTFKRKIQEIILARRLEQSLTKQEIMTLYVNQIYFGHGRYGVQEASRFYFGKDISQVNIGEAAMLGGLVQSPENISPRKHPQRAKERQTYVLNQLAKIGKITQAEAQKWINEPIKVVKEPFPELGSAPEWVDLVRRELVATKGEKAMETGGTVRTTLDPGLQANAQKALQAGLRAVDARQKIGRPKRHTDKIEDEIAKLAKRLPSSGPKAKETYEAVVTAVHDDDNELVVDLGKWQAAIALGTEEDARFNPPEDGKTKKPSERFKPGDIVDVRVPPAPPKIVDEEGEEKTVAEAKVKHAQHRVAFEAGPEGAVVIIDVKSRKVRALVGGYASKVAGFNRATMAKRQPGSSFKSFVYTTAIDSGRYTPAAIVNDAPEVFDLWKPKNYESGKFLGPVRLRDAMKKSINTVAIRVTYDLKPEAIAAMAQKMGIVSELPKEMSLALGSGEVTPLEMTNAVATLAAGGIAMAPRFIEAIDGKQTPATQGNQVIRPEVAYVVTNMMESVVKEGTAYKAAALKIPIAGKTGTSNDSRDAWFVGFTPDYVIGVWIGNDNNEPLGKKETGGTSAVPVFVDIMKSMNQPAKAFPRPAHVVERTIDRETGLLAPEGAEKATTLQEVFVEGTEPTEVAPRAGEVTEETSVTGDYSD